MSRRWVTNADIMAERLGVPKAELPVNLSNCDGYCELKKIIGILKRAISERVEGVCFESEGNNRDLRFRYVGKDNDPLADMRNAKVINNLRQYWKFCQDSAGFFPKSWLEYYFKDCQDLLDMKSKSQKGEQVISASIDRVLTNIEYLPILYEAITNKTVLEIEYKPFDEEQVTLIFHPHFLKEYNGRWHLFGHAKGREPENGYNIALDRIQKRPRENYNEKYISAPSLFYTTFFEDIVGVSHIKDAIKEKIVIRAHSYYMFRLMDTKPIHQSYKVEKEYGEYADGQYAEFSIEVKVNKELIGRLLQMGADLEVMSPSNIREEIFLKVKEMAEMYAKSVELK